MFIWSENSYDHHHLDNHDCHLDNHDQHDYHLNCHKRHQQLALILSIDAHLVGKSRISSSNHDHHDTHYNHHYIVIRIIMTIIMIKFMIIMMITILSDGTSLKDLGRWWKVSH